MEDTGETGDEVLLKVEAGLHNFLVEEKGKEVRISGLFDFQAGAASTRSSTTKRT